MWGAIKSDLFDFINTITEDTTKTLNKVLGEENSEEEISIQQKLVADLRRSYETYGTPIKESDLKDYEKFKKKFSITSLAEDIANVLDEEPEVSRYYTELVPITISPDEFWARLYYRVNLIYRNGGVNLDEEDDEELVWENEITMDNNTTTSTTIPSSLSMMEDRIIEDVNNNQNNSNLKAGNNTNHINITKDAYSSTIGESMSVDNYMKERIIKLEDENQKLKSQEEKLLKRLQELELALTNNNVNNLQVHIDNNDNLLPHPVVEVSACALNNNNNTITNTINNYHVVEDSINNESKSNHSDEGSIVIVDSVPDIPTSTNSILLTPEKVNTTINLMITPIDTSETMMNNHNNLLQALNINTPVITGYYTPAETRIDDHYSITNENERIMNNIHENDLFIDKEHHNDVGDIYDTNNEIKELNKTAQYLASLDDDEEENGWS